MWERGQKEFQDLTLMKGVPKILLDSVERTKNLSKYLSLLHTGGRFGSSS